jgi:DNA-directed RNA polymerase subunit RPC12/RpoP
VKCVECGNTFQKDRAHDGEEVSCPVCEACYTIIIKDGKASLRNHVFEEKDPGEL